MIILESLLLLTAFALCLRTTVTDWQMGVVSNKILLWFSLPCAILNSIYYGFFCRDLLSIFLLNWLVISLISILFYAVHIWGGGDSKLMILLGAAIPARYYYYLGNEALPILSVLIIVFSVGYLYLVVQSVFFALRKEESFSGTYDKSIFIGILRDYIVASIYLSFLINIFTRFIPEFFYDNPVLFLFINAFAVLVIYDYPVFKSKILLGICLVADIMLMRFSVENFSVQQLGIYLVVAILFVLKSLIGRYNYKVIPIDHLCPGMILSSSNVIMMMSSRIENLPTGLTEDMACRLTQEQVDAVKRWSKKKNIQSITIVRKIPFAIFISLGYAIFIILGLIR